ncbi:MAG: hypothetical protein HYV95_06130 [Opitutae bacterium]|nr:hypothetical protein [Opitutae bacterium]
MPKRLFTPCLIVGMLFAGGCAAPFKETVAWPVLPVIGSSATASDSQPLLLTKRELQAELAGAGVHFPMMSDDLYVRIRHASLPVLLDWHEAMTAVYGFSPGELQAGGFARDRSVRLLRMAVSTSLMREPAAVEAAPAIGMVLVKLRQPWGNIAAGESRDFVAVSTDRGLFLLDPVSRRIRPLVHDPAFGRFDFARF